MSSTRYTVGTTTQQSLSATTISATTYYGLPVDIYVTGGTFSSGTATFGNSTGGTFNITGFTGGLTYFTESQSTLSPNNTVYVDSFTANGTTSIVDVAISTKGEGAFSLGIAGVMGDKRGLGAVDFQNYPINGVSTYIASGYQSLIGNGYWNTASINNSTVVNGGRNISSGLFSTILNGYINVASGDYSTIGNGQSNSATGLYSTVINGYGNVVNNSYAFAGGFSSQATGSRAFAYGEYCFANGNYSFAIGNNNIANSNSSIAMGVYANTFQLQNKLSFGTSGFGATGTAQYGKMILNCLTTTETYAELAAQNNPSDERYNLTLQNNQAMHVKGSIIGKQSASLNVGVWDFNYVIVRGVGVATTTIVSSLVTPISNLNIWGTPTITADLSRGYASIKVSGLSGTSIQWVANIDSAEVIYA